MPDGLRSYHPASYDETGAYVVDDTVTAWGFQVRPGQLEALGQWLATVPNSGWYAGANGGALILAGNQVVGEAKLGDFVMLAAGAATVELADGHYQRWAEATTA